MMKRILIIEDEESIAELEKDYLELSGFEVEIENDGGAGLSRALEEDYDLFILDLMLPGIDGLEVARQISCRSCIIFVTSYREYAVEAFDVNAVHYLVKRMISPRFITSAK